MEKTIQFFGPFFSNYSYARISRGLASGINKLESEYKAYLSGDPQTLDYNPSESDLNSRPEIKAIYKAFPFESDIVVYNNYPKTITSPHGLDKLPGKTKIFFLSWEDSIYPKAWVDEINKNIHGILAISSFVKKVLINSGVKIPIEVINLAVDEKFESNKNQKYPLKTSKSIKFYHNSTGKKRKGVDILIRSYYEAFTKNDDVCLVIKTTPTVENEFQKILDQNKKSNSPEVEIINIDLSDEQMSNLQNSVDISVYPSRAEGFGLPAFESMMFKKPVIATNYSGLLDFCTDETSYLIDYKLVNTDISELVNPGAKWAEPNSKHLADLMKEVCKAVKDVKTNVKSEASQILNKKLDSAFKLAQSITWQSSAEKAIQFIKKIESLVKYKDQNYAVLSFYNDETGIADYTQDLYYSLESSFGKFYYLSNKDLADRTAKDAPNVIRCWSTGESTFEELLAFVKKENINILHVQYHSGAMFSAESLDKLVEKLLKEGVQPILTFHAVRGPSFDFIKESKNLNKWSKIFIHNKVDFEYAKESLKNVELLPLPTVEFKKRDKSLIRKDLGLDKFDYIVAAHGLLNKHKNIPEIIKAVSQLKKDKVKALFLSLSAVSPNNIYAQGVYEECVNLVKSEGMENNVVLIKNFLDDADIEVLMQTVDATIFAYDDVGESASASIRKSLASGGVTIVSDINMFQEFKDEVLKLPTPSAKEIYNTIKLVRENNQLKDRLLAAAKKYVHENTYDKRAVEMLMMY